MSTGTRNTDPGKGVEATAKVLHLSQKLPASRRRQVAPNGVLGMLMFVIAEAMFFGGLISAHAIVRAGALRGWPPPGQPRLPVEATLVNTAALIASGVLLYFAQRAYRTSPRAARTPMMLAMLLGSAFVLLQGREWVAMLHQGLTMTSSAHGAFFYLIIGTHGLHALGGIAVLAWAFVRLRRGLLVGSELVTVQIFWYFVVGMWPLLYLRVYL